VADPPLHIFRIPQFKPQTTTARPTFIRATQTPSQKGARGNAAFRGFRIYSGFDGHSLAGRVDELSAYQITQPPYDMKSFLGMETTLGVT